MNHEKPTYQSTKTYGNDVGLSTCFRQWRAESHCRYLHGYSLGFRFTFEATHLDEHGWVQDFGGLKKLKEELTKYFDHKTVVAWDDPHREIFNTMALADVSDVVFMEAVGCEAFAKFAFCIAMGIVDNERVKVVSCEVFEHAGNSAIFHKGG